MTPTLRLALTAAAALSAATLTACGVPHLTTASPPAGKASTAPPSSTAPAPSASTSAPASGTSAGGGSAGAGTGASGSECGAAQLTTAYTNNAQIRNGALDGMSHVDRVVMFVNKGTSTCWMKGYPGVAALNAAGRQTQQAARSSGTPEPLVTLRPGETASALITGNSASCTKLTNVHGLLVTAPDQTTSTRLGAYGSLCLQSLGVQQVQRGNAGGLHLG